MFKSFLLIIVCSLICVSNAIAAFEINPAHENATIFTADKAILAKGKKTPASKFKNTETKVIEVFKGMPNSDAIPTFSVQLVCEKGYIFAVALSVTGNIDIEQVVNENGPIKCK